MHFWNCGSSTDQRSSEKERDGWGERERRRDVACSVKGKRLREPPWVLICPLSPDGREEIALPLLDATIWINIFWYYYRHIKIFYICGLIVSEYVLLFRDAFTICRIDCGCHEEQMIRFWWVLLFLLLLLLLLLSLLDVIYFTCAARCEQPTSTLSSR